MSSTVRELSEKYRKPHVVDVRSGDTVRVHQKIREGSKERIQIFEGLVMKASRKNSHTSSIKVRRIASGIGVEKTYLLHSPLVTKIEVVKRSKVRRNYLSYMRARTGKAARLSSVAFDQEAVNKVPEVEKPKAEEAEAPKDEVKTAETADVEAPAEKQEEPKQAPVEEAKTENTEEKSAE